MERYYAFWRRLAAGLFDGIVLILIYSLIAKICIAANEFPSYNFTVGLTVIYIFYNVLLTGLSGQTIGKIVMGIKVLDLGEKKVIGIKRAFFRDSVPIILQCFSLIIITIKHFEIVFIPEQVSIFFENMVSKSSFCWLILELITMFINKKRRAIHDFLAASVVISLKGLEIDKLDDELTAKRLSPII